MPETDWGALAQHWLDRLAACSELGPGVTRLPFTLEHRAALAVLTELMEQAGLVVRLDAAGTLIGRQDGPDGAPALLMGSHQDSVREGGAYDGIMGVVLPVLTLMKLHQDGVTLPFAVEVLAFADEEGDHGHECGNHTQYPEAVGHCDLEKLLDLIHDCLPVSLVFVGF